MAWETGCRCGKTTSIRSGVNNMSLLLLVQTSDYCLLLDVSHYVSIAHPPLLPSFKVLCILLSVCLWRSHRPRSCTLGGPIACVLPTPGGPTAKITCLNIDDTTTLAPIPAVRPLHTMLCQSTLMHDLCSNYSHFWPMRAAQEPPVALRRLPPLQSWRPSGKRRRSSAAC